MNPDRKLWKLSVWNYNIIVIQNVLNKSNRSKAGKKILLWIANIRRSFFLAPFWHRWSYFSIINLSVFHLADKCFTITNLINLRIILFLEYRKTPETLRFRGILRLDTMYLAVLNLFYIDRSANLDFASLHLGLGVRPINSPTNVLVWANSHRTLLCEFALLIACRILFDNCSNTSWSNSTSTFTFVRFLKSHYFLWFSCLYCPVL